MSKVGKSTHKSKDEKYVNHLVAHVSPNMAHTRQALRTRRLLSAGQASGVHSAHASHYYVDSMHTARATEIRTVPHRLRLCHYVAPQPRFVQKTLLPYSRESSVGIAKGHGLGRKICLYSSVQTGSGAHPTSYRMRTAVSLWGVKPQGMKLTTHLHPVPRSRMAELHLHSPIRLHCIELFL
jgi:hypothetical protein